VRDVVVVSVCCYKLRPRSKLLTKLNQSSIPKPDIGQKSRFLSQLGPRRNIAISFGMEQELSYRKQIARQLRTHVEGIYDNPVTLKSKLTVTQGHWKRNYWVDYTRLTIRLVIGRWILSWPWNVSQRSLKVIEISAIRKLGCGFLFAFYSNYGRICSRLWDIQCQKMAWRWKPG